MCLSSMKTPGLEYFKQPCLKITWSHIHSIQAAVRRTGGMGLRRVETATPSTNLPNHASSCVRETAWTDRRAGTCASHMLTQCCPYVDDTCFPHTDFYPGRRKCDILGKKLTWRESDVKLFIATRGRGDVMMTSFLPYDHK